MSVDLTTGADFSPCRRYRHSLWRRWHHAPLFSEGEKPLAAFIGLNPSTADEILDDNTIRKCLGYAAAWENVGGIVMLNLFDIRATDPRTMKQFEVPCSPENDATIKRYIAEAAMVVCCWGNDGRHRGRDREVLKLLAGCELLCFGRNKNGTPKHPLYLSGRAKLERFEP